MRLALLAIVFAVFAQTWAFGGHSARAGEDARGATAALAKIVGAPVWICVQDPGPGAPQTPDSHHDSCPLCRLAEGTLALEAPEGAHLPAAPAPKFVAPLPRSRTYAPPPAPSGFALARGPPFSI